ncbi:hypothetical protein BG011_002569 [Mortierella polycephala]|uniref:Uncharacterized protein n=1 Tax=Mortierella polycephala TaxID=41804 RepID=A0A9P6U3Z6_9FUNG|nr:hypothetical protein BG011_002569 [Mortierella polycephala]
MTNSDISSISSDHIDFQDTKRFRKIVKIMIYATGIENLINPLSCLAADAEVLGLPFLVMVALFLKTSRISSSQAF